LKPLIEVSTIKDNSGKDLSFEIYFYALNCCDEHISVIHLFTKHLLYERSSISCFYNYSVNGNKVYISFAQTVSISYI